MRRFLVVLLLALLPLHLSWAAAAVYCQHEPGGQSQHLGHHEHQHHGGDVTGDADSKAAGSIDHDCGACQAAGWAALVGVTVPITCNRTRDAFDIYRCALASPPVAVPDRPNWPRRA